jgi:hypothetical protein
MRGETERPIGTVSGSSGVRDEVAGVAVMRQAAVCGVLICGVVELLAGELQGV